MCSKNPKIENYYETVINKGKTKKKRNAEFLPDKLIMLIIGPTGSGKSVLLMNMILKGWVKFDKLYVYSKTLYQDIMIYLQQNIQAAEAAAKKRRVKDPKIGHFCNEESQLPYPNECDSKKNNLLILDDCINEKQDGKIMSYFTQGRHNNFNVIYLSQSYHRVPKQCIRENASYVVLFEGLSGKDISSIHQAYSPNLSLEQFKQFYKKGCEDDTGFVTINMCAKPKDRLRIGFCDEYKIT